MRYLIGGGRSWSINFAFFGWTRHTRATTKVDFPLFHPGLAWWLLLFCLSHLLFLPQQPQRIGELPAESRHRHILGFGHGGLVVD